MDYYLEMDMQELAREALEAAYLRKDWSTLDDYRYMRDFMSVVADMVEDVEDELQHKSMLKQPAGDPKFRPFGRLPIELRQMIWRVALPGLEIDGNRILRVRVEVLRDLQKTGLRLRFELSKKKWSSCLITSSKALDLSLSLACTESRAIFLEAFPYALPAAKRSVMRFNQDTTIYIENFDDALTRPIFQNHLSDYAGKLYSPLSPTILPPYFENITRLVLPRACLSRFSRFIEYCPSTQTRVGPFVPMFKGLQHLGFEFHHSSSSKAELTQVKDLSLVKEYLDNYKTLTDPEYAVPTVRLLQPPVRDYSYWAMDGLEYFSVGQGYGEI